MTLLDSLPADLLNLLIDLLGLGGRVVLSRVCTYFHAVLSNRSLVSYVASDRYPDRALSTFFAAAIKDGHGPCFLQRARLPESYRPALPDFLSVYVFTGKIVSEVSIDTVRALIVRKDQSRTSQQDDSSVETSLKSLFGEPFDALQCVMFDNISFTHALAEGFLDWRLDTICLRLCPREPHFGYAPIFPPFLVVTLCVTLDGFEGSFDIPPFTRKLILYGGPETRPDAPQVRPCYIYTTPPVPSLEHE
jgi:hypothetical protein